MFQYCFWFLDQNFVCNYAKIQKSNLQSTFKEIYDYTWSFTPFPPFPYKWFFFFFGLSFHLFITNIHSFLMWTTLCSMVNQLFSMKVIENIFVGKQTYIGVETSVIMAFLMIKSRTFQTFPACSIPHSMWHSWTSGCQFILCLRAHGPLLYGFLLGAGGDPFYQTNSIFTSYLHWARYINAEEKENEEAASQSCPWRSFGFTLIHI